MTQANREKLAKHYKDLGVEDSKNPYASDLKILNDDIVEEEVKDKPKKKRALW